MGALDGSDLLLLLPITALAILLTFAVTLLVALRVGKHAVVDVTWGLGFVVVAATSFVVARSAAEIDAGRGLLLLVITGLWGTRLAWHIGQRSRGHGEDPRYEALMAKARGNPTVHAVTRVYLTQAVSMWFISLPVQVGMLLDASLGWVAWTGVLVWAVGLFFETVGDHQLDRFRKDPSTKGQVLDTGLWRYTRHPNYFGDACVWWGIFLVAADAWPGALTVLSPVFMTFLLAKGTGKPLLEKDMASRRPGYKEYVERTSGFVPLPPRKG